jgi:uncharacterized protein (TIGR02246 family)
MHHLRIASMLCGMALWAGTAMAAEETPSAGQCFSEAFKAADADEVAACYAEDAIIWFPGGSMAQGRPAIRAGFAHFFSEVSAMTIKDVALTEIGHVMGAGDTRTAWGTYEIRMVDKTSGAEMVQRGRFTDVSKKIAGRWLYLVDHPSDDPPPPVAK